MAKNDYNNVFIGAAVGTLLGSISALFIPEREMASDNLFDKVKSHTKGFTEGVMSGVRKFNGEDAPQNNFLKGTLIGLAIGATSLAFLHPSTGRQIRNGFMNAYSEVSDKAQELGRSLNYSHPNIAKKVRAAVKKHATAKKRPVAKKHKAVAQAHKKVHA